MGKENVLEIEYQEVFDEVAVRIKNINNNFFSDGFYKEDVEKYNLSEIVIDYGLKTLRIETKNGKVITKNLGKYGIIWTMVMEILE